MMRIDDDLAFMLRFENIAWFDDGAVRILDRRIYPARTSFVTCRSVEDLVQAIRDMVTQSAGPYLAASQGMVLAAHEAKDWARADFDHHMREAAASIAHARPTTSDRMTAIVKGALAAALEADQDHVVERVMAYSLAEVTARYEKIHTMGELLAGMFSDGGTIMTQCYADTIVGMMLRAARRRGNEVRLICPETRPYLQGARLTATVVADMGFDVTVITDNMPFHTMKTKDVSLFTSAADVLTLDGHVVNKVGTSQIALCANHLGIPYFVTGIPNPKHPTIRSVTLEERNPEEVLEFRGIRTTAEGVRGYYPAFDITPPSDVNGVVTDKGMFSAFGLGDYFA